MTDKEQLSYIFDKVKDQKAELYELKRQDVTLLLKLANRVKKLLKDEPGNDIKIAVLGSYSIQHFVGVLNAFLYGCGIHADIYEGEYDGIHMDVLDKNSEYYAFNPNITILLMDDRDIKTQTQYFANQDEMERLSTQQYGIIENLWTSIHEKLSACQIIQSNIVIPPLRPLGNLESSYIFTRSELLRQVNEKMSSSHPGYVSLVDMEYLAGFVGKRGWFDYSSYFLTKAGFSPDYLGIVCGAVAEIIFALRGKNRKCLVMDLDNTLWGGVVGDDGYDGIQIDPHNAVGEAYRHFQRYILELKRRGVILAVCSKNEENIAKEPFEKNNDMILNLSDIACFVANWEDKAGNIRNIASLLNIGTDSLVFVDDNPAEREIVKSYLPEVMVIDMPEDPALYALALEESGAFNWASITKEDISRADSYAANNQRQELLESFVDYEEYLRALEMRAQLGEPEGAALSRFTQLINKSNQFNLRTQRYSDSDILAMKEDDSYRLIAVSLEDKFTEYGVISCIILKINGEECFVDTWLMSCRVLKRGIEQIALNSVVECAKKAGSKKIIGEYIPTKKNKMVADFYKKMGFKEFESNRYELTVDDYIEKSAQITIL